MSDAELFGQFLNEDAGQAFRLIHGQYADDIVRLCLGRLHNFADAQDASQETFLALLRRRDTLVPVELQHYLRRIARYAANDILRKRTAADRVAHEIAGNPRATPSSDEVLAEESQTQERRRFVMQALETMTPQEQHLLRQRFLDGVSVREIARALAISEAATRARLRRAVKHLKARVNPDADDGPRPRK